MWLVVDLELYVKESTNSYKYDSEYIVELFMTEIPGGLQNGDLKDGEKKV